MRTTRGRELPLSYPPSNDEGRGNFVLEENRARYISDAERIARIRAGEDVFEYHYTTCSGALDDNWRGRRPIAPKAA